MTNALTQCLRQGDWRVLFFCRKKGRFASMFKDAPDSEAAIRVCNDFHKATELLLKEDFNLVMADVSQYNPLGKQLIAWLHVNKPHIPAFFLGELHFATGEIDKWGMDSIPAFAHIGVSVDPLTHPLAMLFSVDTPLEWISHVKCVCLRARKNLQPRNTNIILLKGATGSGKSALAQISHFNSDRRPYKFIFANCKRIDNKQNVYLWDDKKMESFRRSFRFMAAQAANGTLYLHDIDALDDTAQEILAEELAILRSRRNEASAPTQIVCASKRSITDLTLKGEFNSALYSVINEVVVTVPMLNEFKGDMADFAEQLLGAFCTDNKYKTKRFSVEASEAIREHPWGENIRELFSTIRHAVMMTDYAYIKPEHLNLAHHIAADDTVTDQLHLIKKALKKAKGVVSKAARDLGISRSGLYEKMKELDIPNGFGRSEAKQRKAAPAPPEVEEEELSA